MTTTSFIFRREGALSRSIDFLKRVHDLVWEGRLGINTRGFNRAEDNLSALGDGLHYEYVPYYLLQMIFRRIPSKENHAFADYGCGKGRVTAFASRFPFRKVTGIELRPELAAIAERNMARVRGKKAPFEIITADVVSVDPDPYTAIFFFNPFGERTMLAVLEEIRLSLARNPRKILLIYYNPVCRHVLESRLWLSLRGDLSFEAPTTREARYPTVLFYEAGPGNRFRPLPTGRETTAAGHPRTQDFDRGISGSVSDT